MGNSKIWVLFSKIESKNRIRVDLIVKSWFCKKKKKVIVWLIFNKIDEK